MAKFRVAVLFIASLLEVQLTQVHGAVRIVASYNPPSTFTLDPPSYRAATPLTLTCEVEGVDQYSGYFFQWSSTCSGSCFVQGSTHSVSTPYLHSYDTGVHTCVAHGASGYVGSANISVNVVGAGIFVTSSSTALPNNSLITAISSSLKFIPSFQCLSGSSQPNVGNLIGPQGTVITFSSSDPFSVSRGGSHDPGTMSVHSVRQLQAQDVGVYTYLTPDHNGAMTQFHFGIYLANEGPPTFSDMSYTASGNLYTLACVSHGSPPTQVMWKRDGKEIHLNNHTISSQDLVNRTSSTYKNTLTINSTIEDVVGEYSCRVNNSLGASNQLNLTFKVLEVSGHESESPVLVGLSRSINCSTHLAVTRMEWVLVGVAEPLEEREDGGQSLILLINPTDAGMNGSKYTCRVTTKAGNIYLENITVLVKEVVHNVNITGPSTPAPLSAGGKYTLTCTVTAEFTPSVQWLDPYDNVVEGSDVAMITVTNGNTTTVHLHFDPLKTSHAGKYACVSTNSESEFFKRRTVDVVVQITTDSTTVTRDPSDDMLYTSDELTITCVTTVNQAVDIPVNVSHQWVGPVGMVSTNNEVHVSDVVKSGQNYTSALLFISQRSGTYNCSSTVNANQSSVFIASSAVTTVSTSFSAAIRVSIEINYDSPGTYPVYSPPNYRTASGVTLRCVASGYSGSISYHWTSTCSSCFASDSHSQTISDNFLKRNDAGVHTCSVTDGLGNTGSNSTTMKIVGVGIYIKYADSSHTQSSSGVQGAQPSNSFAITNRYGSSLRVSLYCCSNTTAGHTGSFTFPTGYKTFRYFENDHRIHVTRYSIYDANYGGCIELKYYYYYNNISFFVNPNHRGIYTCTMLDSNGNKPEENIGIYDYSFSSSPSVYKLQYNNNNTNDLILVCKTRNSPPTIIKWYRDEELLDIDGISTTMNINVTNRQSSSYDITLTVVCDSLADNVLGSYRCEVGNRLGSDSETYHVKGLQVQCSSEFVVGENVTCYCSSDIEFSAVYWFDKDTPGNTGNGNGISRSGGSGSGGGESGSGYGGSGSGGSLRPLDIVVTTDDHGKMYTCSLSSSCGSQNESVTVDVIVPDQWATVSVHNSTGENALNNTDYTLTCTVTHIEGMNLPVTVEWVGPDGSVVASEGNVIMGEVAVQGTVSTLSLSFSPVFSSDAGSYTCRAAISVPWSSTQPAHRLATVHMPVTSQALFRVRLYSGLPLCINWNSEMAFDLELHIKREVEKAVRERCNCAFSSSAIYSGRFGCIFGSAGSECDLATYVTYRAILNGTSDLLTAPQLMQHLLDWRGTAGTLIYNVFHLKLASHAECRVNISSLDEAEC